MLPAGFEPAIPARKRQQTHTLDRAATGIGMFLRSFDFYMKDRRGPHSSSKSIINCLLQLKCKYQNDLTAAAA